MRCNYAPKRVMGDTLSFDNTNATVQLWDKKVKRDEDLSDSEDEGEGGRRFEKERSMKTSSKPSGPSGEASMDISKAPSPTAGTTGLDGAGLGLSSDVPGPSKVGQIEDRGGPLFGGVEAAGGLGAMASSTAMRMGLGLGDIREGDMTENAAEKDTDMAG